MKKFIPTGIAAGVLAGGFWAVGENYYTKLVKAAPAEGAQLGAPSYKDQTITAWDGVTLFGRAMSSKDHRWVIGVHPYRETGVAMLPFMLHYRTAGWNVLLPDLRGHGKSEGQCVGLGLLDRLDLIDWVTWIVDKDPAAQIVIHGVSMGASAAVMAAGEGLPENVKAIIADSACNSLKDALTVYFNENSKVPPFAAIAALDLVTNSKAGFKPSQIVAADFAAKSKTPILYIHGSADEKMAPSMTDELYCATTAPAERVFFLNAGHMKSVEADPERYWSTVDKFINARLS